MVGVKGYYTVYIICKPCGTSGHDQKFQPTHFDPVISTCKSGRFFTSKPNGSKGCHSLGDGLCEAGELLSSVAEFIHPCHHCVPQ